jgi:hypothetical protein
MRVTRTALLAFACGCQATDSRSPSRLAWIRPSDDRTHFVSAETGDRFAIWGVNYDHDARGRLLEDYWHDEWHEVAGDFAEIAALGANAVRIHLQLGRLMTGPDVPNSAELDRLRRLVGLAESNGLYLDVTGLGCYHAPDVPRWYDALSEAERWDVQARFWASVAATCHESPAILCYDLMNEPILPGAEPATEWLAGEFGGKHFVQRIALDLAGRTREDVARRWVEKLVAAIRQHDDRHMITVGVIPWALTFPGAKPLFYAGAVAKQLDFVSVHFYPKRGELDAALRALRVYEVGKPLVVEECFPLRCDIDELCEFIDRSHGFVDGWMSFYWGKQASDYEREGKTIGDAIIAGWLERFAARSTTMRTVSPR